MSLPAVFLAFPGRPFPVPSRQTVFPTRSVTMSLCHDERDYAMGFSRRDPHASREPSLSDRKSRKRRAEYLPSLTPEQKTAHDRVEFCLGAIGQYFVSVGEMVPLPLCDLHEHFPTFARMMGYEEPGYQRQDGRCAAVGIAYPETPGRFWLLTPYHHYYGLPEAELSPFQSPEARAAALAFLNAWLPAWKWDKVKLP